MATRSDPALRKRFEPVIHNFETMRRTAAPKVAQDLTANLAPIQTLIHLHQMVMRGLAIELMFTEDAADIERARQIFVGWERTFAMQLAGMDRETVTPDVLGQGALGSTTNSSSAGPPRTRGKDS